MCGRFALYSSEKTIEAIFGIELEEPPKPRFNIAPTDPILGIRLADGIRTASRFRWGLVPRSIAARRGLKGKPIINARGETAPTRGIFKYALRHRRLLVPADGVYEWRKTDTGKQPLFIETNGEPFAMGGLYETATLTDGTVVRSATVLTVEANPLIATLHDRMPLIVPRSAWNTWLDPEIDETGILPLLVPFPAQAMQMHEVSRRVNSVRNDDRSCLDPPQDTEQLRLL